MQTIGLKLGGSRTVFFKLHHNGDGRPTERTLAKMGEALGRITAILERNGDGTVRYEGGKNKAIIHLKRA